MGSGKREAGSGKLYGAPALWPMSELALKLTQRVTNIFHPFKIKKSQKRRSPKKKKKKPTRFKCSLRTKAKQKVEEEEESKIKQGNRCRCHINNLRRSKCSLCLHRKLTSLKAKQRQQGEVAITSTTLTI